MAAALAVVVVAASISSAGATTSDTSGADSLTEEELPAEQQNVTVDFSDAELEALMTRFSFWDNEDWDWYLENIPFVETPDGRLDEVYYYRWELVTKHLRYASPQIGYVATEFNDAPAYGGAYGAISAPSGHQLYEMQWLRDRRFAEDYISFYLNQHSSKPYSYANWLADNVWSLYEVYRNETYATDLLSELVKYYEHFEEMQFNPRLGLYWVYPVWDAMERTVSSKRTSDAFHGGPGYRSSINGYMYGNALAIQEIATLAGDSSLAAEYGQKAAALKTNLQNRLWDDEREFFLHMYRTNEHLGIRAETLIDDTGPYTSDKKGREQIGYVPWAFNMPDDLSGSGYEAAWKFLVDENYFKAAYGPRSAELSDHHYGVATRCCHWSGQSWPYATTSTLKGMANVLQDYDQSEIDKEDYIDTLNTYVDVHMAGKSNGTGITPYIAEASHPDTGSWDGHDRTGHSEHYFHSGYVDLVITELLGLQPQSDDTLVLKPLVPDNWDYFLLNNVRYHGHDITVIWDRDGTKYNRGSGYQIFVDGVRVHQSDTVSASANVNVGTPVLAARDNLVNYAVNNTGNRYPEATATNSFRNDPPGRATNGKYYYTSSPPDRWTSYHSRASEDRFAVDFGQDRPIHTVKLYLYDDGGGVQKPSSYQIQYWNGSAWTDVQETSRNPATPTSNRANVVEFSQVSTSRVRAVLTRNNGIAVGMTEFEVWGPAQPVADPPASDNLALNADAWKYPRIYPSFAFIHDSVFEVHDGNRSTYWGTRYSRNETEFLRVDFGGEETLNTIALRFRVAPTAVNFEYLNSGTWTAIPNVRTTPDTPADNTKTTATFPAITAEQVRINFTSSDTISVNEIEIYEQNELEALMTRFSFWENEDWDWYIDNIPFIETPEGRLDEVYYYRWQLVTTHLRYASPQVGYVATEFNDSPRYAGAFGAIVAPSGHQLYEMQWLRDRRFAEDYITFYLSQHSSKPYSYSTWMAENLWSLTKVHRNEEYAKELLSELVKYFEHYEEMQFNPTLGLFWSAPVWDAMEHTISSRRSLNSYHGGDGYRPTLNSYMYANALAIQNVATMAGESSLATEYGRKAAALKANMQNRLWDDDRNFFLHMYRLDERDGILAETLIDDTGPFTSDKKGREEIGFIPWAFNLPDDQTGTGYEAAWQFFDDPAYFQAPYGPRTAELSDHHYGLRSRCCHWSGQSWPYSTTQSLKALANVVQNYDQSEVDKSDYITALNTYVDVHMRGKNNGRGIRPYIAEAIHPDTGSWDGHDRRSHSENYFHSGYVDLVLSGLFGLQPQPDDTLVLKPLVPDAWDYFLLDNLRYHGHEITIIWDRDGTRYNRGSGYQIFVDETRVHNSDTVPDSATINVGAPVVTERDNLVNYAVNNTGGQYPEASATYSFRSDPPSEATNGKYYYTDVPLDRWTTWQSSAREHTFSVDFGQNRPIHTVKLYIYDDGGGVQTPSSYQIQYWNGSSWADVQETSRNPATPTGNRANVVEFYQVSTSRVRAVLSLNAGIAVGMTEFEAWGPSQPVADPPASDNLALNADAWKYPRIYPSFAYINDAVFRAHDGNRNTFWSNRESRNGTNEFLRVDLDEEETFKTVEVNFRDAPTSMNLEYLNNGSWTAIPDVRMTPATPADNTTTTATFPAITTEQIRINLTTTGTTQSNGFISNDAIISIREIEIYEDGPGVTVVGDDLTVYEGGDETYTVVLTSQPTADVTVTINDPTDHGDVTASPASLTFTSSNWNREQGVTVTASPDDDTLDEEATVTHTVSSTDAHYNALAVEDVTVTVIDSNLRARFEQVPTRHDGSSEFRFQLHFSEDVRLRHTDFSGTLFETTGGTVTGARRLNPPHSDSGLQNNSSWEVVATPDGSGDIVITLPAGRGCDTDGAVCSPNDEHLGATVAATIAGPGPYVTARFEQVPSSHDGSTELRFQLHFSEEVNLNHTDFSGALFETAGGTVTGARRLDPPSNIGWEVVARPDGPDDMIITLPAGRGCNGDGAVCTSDRSWLGATVVATIAGPGVSATARFEQVPSSHDGSTELRFQLHFSEEVNLNHTDFSGALFETAGGTVTGARRLDPPSNIGWEVVARPDGDGNMIITLPAGRGCDTDGAVCAPDGSWLASTITTTIAGPGPTVTARFEQVPSNHDGSSEFRFQLHFSEEVDLSATDFTGALFITAGGTVISATRLQPPSTVGWEVVARPDGTDDMFITLPEGRGCNTDGAVCAPDGSWLASTVTTTIAGPGPTVTARFEQVPSSHDGSTELRFQLHFSEEVNLNHTGRSVVSAMSGEGRH